MPVVSNFIGSKAEPIDSSHDLWKRFLPCDRILPADQIQTADEDNITYGAYFSAANAFLTGNNHHHLRKALEQALNQEIFAEDIQEVDLHLLKHGKYYHPGRVTVRVKGQAFSFALNVAVSSEGRKIIAGEYQNLRRLKAEFPIAFIPDVYAFDDITQSNGLAVKMFLGEWFDDYHEFHLSSISTDAPSNNRHVVVWDETRTRLNEWQTRDLLQKAGMILTFYYNPETSEQIFPWHHAAGDFVIKAAGKELSLKLITVRGYTPLLDNNADSDNRNSMPAKILEGLLLFFIHLSLRMRMDRLDGVGELTLYDEDCIPAIVKGFFQGLDLAASLRGYPDDFCSVVKTYLCHPDKNAVEELAGLLIARYARLDGSGVLRRFDLSRHVRYLKTALIQ